MMSSPNADPWSDYAFNVLNVSGVEDFADEKLRVGPDTWFAGAVYDDEWFGPPLGYLLPFASASDALSWLRWWVLGAAQRHADGARGMDDFAPDQLHYTEERALFADAIDSARREMSDEQVLNGARHVLLGGSGFGEHPNYTPVALPGVDEDLHVYLSPIRLDVLCSSSELLLRLRGGLARVREWRGDDVALDGGRLVMPPRSWAVVDRAIRASTGDDPSFGAVISWLERRARPRRSRAAARVEV